MIQINQINVIFLAFFPVKERRWNKLYLDNTELAVFARNPSISVRKRKKSARTKCQS